jgi:predicted DNA-binding transcriptional regulator YafY
VRNVSHVSNAIIMYLLLQHKKIVKTQEIASFLEISDRMVRRYRKDLELAGIYIESMRGKYGGYRLYNDNLLLGLNMTTQENCSLQLVEKYLRDSGHIASKDISNLVEKINALNSIQKKEMEGFENYFAKATKPNVDNDIERKKLLDIHTAVLLRKKIRINYTSIRSGETVRVVRPYATLQYKLDMYFMGFCELKEQVLDFKLSRINSYEMLDEFFREDKDFDLEKSMENCFGIYKDKEYNIRLKIMFPMSQIVKEKVWVKNQTITENKDKSIIYEAKMRGLTEIKNWILGMGSAVIAEQPKELVNEIKDEINKMRNLYYSP